MTALFFWCLWSFIASIGIKYTSMQLLNVDLKLLNAFLILLVYQWIRFVKPLSKKELKENNTKSNVKQKNNNINKNSLSDFNNIINNGFKKKK